MTPELQPAARGVRRLRRTICSTYAEKDEEGRPRLYCVTLDPSAEDLVSGYIDRGPAGTSMSIPPQVANRIASAVATTAEPLLTAGHQLVVLTSPSVRAQVKQILEAQIPNAAVLSYNEVVKGLDVESMGLVEFDEAREEAVEAIAAAV